MLVLLLAQRVRGNGAGASASPALATAGAFATLLAVAPFVATQATGAVFQVAMARSTGFIADGGRTAPLRDVVWYRALFEPSFMPEEFTVADALKWQHLLPPQTVSAILGDGIDLLRREGLDQRRIANLNFSNPFPMALHAPSPRGVALWWDPDRTFVKGKITAPMIVGDAEVVMQPKLWWYYFVVQNLTDETADLLNQDFTPHESQYWIAWVRR